MLYSRWLFLIGIFFLASCNVSIKTSSSGLYIKKQRVKVVDDKSEKVSPNTSEVASKKTAFPDQSLDPIKKAPSLATSSIKWPNDLTIQATYSKIPQDLSNRKRANSPEKEMGRTYSYAFNHQNELSTNRNQIDLTSFNSSNALKNFFKILMWIFGVALSFIVLNYTYRAGINYYEQAALAGGALELLILYAF